MQTKSIEKLLTAMLDMQIETGENRNQRSLFTRPHLTMSANEVSTYFKSPVARYQLIDSLQAEYKKATQKLVEQKIELRLLPLAADDKEQSVKEFNCTGYSVVLYDNRDKGCPIIILLQLNKEVLDVLTPLFTIRLFDSGGLEWLRGKPNKQGEISAEWLDASIDLFARAKQYCLQIEFV